MVQTPTAVCLVAAVATGLFLYSVKHSMTEMDRGIAHAFEATKAANQRSALLRAEWSDLTAPQRLEQAAGQYTTLRPIPPAQYVSLDDLPAHLPAPGSIVPDAPAPNPATPGAETPNPAALALSAAPPPDSSQPPAPPAVTSSVPAPAEPPISLAQRAPAAASAHATPHQPTNPPTVLAARPATPPRKPQDALPRTARAAPRILVAHADPAHSYVSPKPPGLIASARAEPYRPQPYHPQPYHPEPARPEPARYVAAMSHAAPAPPGYRPRPAYVAAAPAMPERTPPRAYTGSALAIGAALPPPVPLGPG